MITKLARKKLHKTTNVDSVIEQFLRLDFRDTKKVMIIALESQYVRSPCEATENWAQQRSQYYMDE